MNEAVLQRILEMATQHGGANADALFLKAVHQHVRVTLRNPVMRHLFLPQVVPHSFELLPGRRERFYELFDEYQDDEDPFVDPIRVLQFMDLLDIANEAPEGDYLEIGTYKGKSAKIIFKQMDPARTLYCIDTFAGFAEADVAAEQRATNLAAKTGFLGDTSAERVADYISGGRRCDNLQVIEGWFPDAFAGLEDRQWRFVHLDMDLYEPTRVALEILWPRLVPGGVMVFHDYRSAEYRGIKLAVDDYLGRIGLRALPMGDRWFSAMVVKPRPPTAP